MPALTILIFIFNVFPYALAKEEIKEQSTPFQLKLDMLHLAAIENDIELAKELIKQRLTRTNIKDAEKSTPLHHAALHDSLDVAQILIKNKSQIEALNKDKNTPLHLAALKNSPKVAKLLLENSANSEAYNNVIVDPKKSSPKLTPLHLAALHNNLEVAETLLAYGADANAPVKVNLEFEEYVAYTLLIPVVMFLTSEHAQDEYTPLHFATEKGHLEMAQLLLDSGADVNAQDDIKFTPLHLAARDGNLEMAKLLLNRGADPNKITIPLSWSALQIVGSNNHHEMIALLKSYGAM